MTFRHMLLALALIIGCRAWAADCKQPLDENTLRSVGLGQTPNVQLKPGGTYQFRLAVLSTYAPSEPLQACATWKVEPEGKGASISADGLLKIDPATPSDSKFVVTADIEKGRAQRSMQVVIYTDETQPLIGFWKQTGFTCKSSDTTPVPNPGTIEEMEFRAGGFFSVTWLPFETYRDYWGSYTIDISKKTLSLKPERGNYIPSLFHGDGDYKLVDPATLELHGIFLGMQQKAAANQPAQVPAGCIYTFKRM